MKARDHIEAINYLNTMHNYEQKLSAILISLINTSHAWFVDNRKLLYNLELCTKKFGVKNSRKLFDRDRTSNMYESCIEE